LKALASFVYRSSIETTTAIPGSTWRECLKCVHKSSFPTVLTARFAELLGILYPMITSKFPRRQARDFKLHMQDIR
jgi:hypothetical protein